MLSPIREYIGLRYEVAKALFEPLVSYHEGLAQRVEREYSSNDRPGMLARVTPQLENIQVVFKRGLGEPELATRVAFAVADFAGILL